MDRRTIVVATAALALACASEMRPTKQPVAARRAIDDVALATYARPLGPWEVERRARLRFGFGAAGVLVRPDGAPAKLEVPERDPCEPWIELTVIDIVGDWVRVAERVDDVAIAQWVARSRLAPAIVRDVELAAVPGVTDADEDEETYVMVLRNAPVAIRDRREGWVDVEVSEEREIARGWVRAEYVSPVFLSAAPRSRKPPRGWTAYTTSPLVVTNDRAGPPSIRVTFGGPYEIVSVAGNNTLLRYAGDWVDAAGYVHTRSLDEGHPVVACRKFEPARGGGPTDRRLDDLGPHDVEIPSGTFLHASIDGPPAGLQLVRGTRSLRVRHDGRWGVFASSTSLGTHELWVPLARLPDGRFAVRPRS